MAKSKSRRSTKKEARPTPDAQPVVAAPKPVEVAVTPAKGRPMLHWVGKRPLSRVRYFPAQQVEIFEPSGVPTLRALKRGPTGQRHAPKAAYCSTGTTKRYSATSSHPASAER